jgi:hypothetical protein
MDAVIDLVELWRPLNGGALSPTAIHPPAPASPCLDGSSKGKEGKIGEEGPDEEKHSQEDLSMGKAGGGSSDHSSDDPPRVERDVSEGSPGKTPGAGGVTGHNSSGSSDTKRKEGADPGAPEEPLLLLLLLEVLARTIVVTGGGRGQQKVEGSRHLCRWKERNGWGLLVFIILGSGEGPSSGKAIDDACTGWEHVQWLRSASCHYLYDDLMGRTSDQVGLPGAALRSVAAA